MNILPLVITILLILSIAAATVSQRGVATLIEKRAITGYLNAQRKLWNSQERARYKKMGGESKESRQPQSPPVTPPLAIVNKEETADEDEEEEVVKRRYFREKRCQHESGKFNLSPLLHNYSANADPLYEPAARLIRHLYEHAPFWKKDVGLEYQILDALMRIEDRSLADVIPENSDLAPIFYKMVKGSNTYIVGTDNGIPPFLDFFRDDGSTKGSKSINFLSAPKPVVLAFLGEEVFAKVEAAERNDNKPLSKENLFSLLEAFPQKKTELDLFNPFLFAKKRDEPIDLVTDGATDISVKK